MLPYKCNANPNTDLGTHTGLYCVASQLAPIAGPTSNGYIVERGRDDYDPIFVVTPAGNARLMTSPAEDGPGRGAGDGGGA